MDPKEKEMFDKLVKDTSDAILAPVTEQVVKDLMEKLPNRKDLFGSDNATTEETKSKEIAVEFFKGLVGKNTKALDTVTDGSGADLVPTYVSNTLIGVAGKFGLVRQYARQWPMSGAKENAPSLGSVEAYRSDDGADLTVESPSSDAVALSTKTVGVIIPVSRKLLENATVELINALTIIGGRGLAKLEDKWGLLGLASGEGVFQNTNVPGVVLGSGKTKFSDASPEDLLDVMNKVNEDAIDESTRWIMSLSVLNAFRAKRNAVGSDKQGFLLEGATGPMPNSLWSLPYSTTSIMPKTTLADADQDGVKFLGLVSFNHILFGDAKKYRISIADQATLKLADNSTINLWQKNMVALKVEEEIDIKLDSADQAFAYLKTAAIV